jgi:hypothetical protein
VENGVFNPPEYGGFISYQRNVEEMHVGIWDLE